MKELKEAIQEAEYLTSVRGLVHVIDVLHKVHIKALYQGNGIYETTLKAKEDVKEIEPVVAKKGKKNNIVIEDSEIIS